jgi:hypothetical protein
MRKYWTIGLLAGALIWGSGASAYVIDFEQGGTAGGDLQCSAGNCTGTDIPFTELKADTTNDGLIDTNHTADALLNFDTAANTITLVGSVAALGIFNETLLSGSFSSWGTITGGGTLAFFGSGPDEKSERLLTALGIPTDTQWAFFTFQLSASTGGEVQSADIRNSTVPAPGTLGLLGIGLLGFGLVASRRRNLPQLA